MHSYHQIRHKTHAQTNTRTMKHKAQEALCGKTTLLLMQDYLKQYAEFIIPSHNLLSRGLVLLQKLHQSHIITV